MVAINKFTYTNGITINSPLKVLSLTPYLTVFDGALMTMLKVSRQDGK